MITRRLNRPLSALSSTTWTCPSCTEASLLPSQRQQGRRPERRSIHHITPTAYDGVFSKHGIPGLLSAQGYEMAWTQYQNMLLQKLNELTAGTEFYNATVKNILLRTARDPQAASLFNHASMAYNNDHFFKTMSSVPKKLETQPGLKESLESTFGSIDTMRTAMLDTAAAMFGPGFVWLIWARDLKEPGRSGAWRILPTYLAGTPYPEAGYRQQGVDMNTQNATSADDYYNSQPANHVGAFGSFSQTGQNASKLPPGGTSVLPVLCVNTWQHVWLRDYGVAGKRKFLGDWWDAIDWYQVNTLAPTEAKALLKFQR